MNCEQKFKLKVYIKYPFIPSTVKLKKWNRIIKFINYFSYAFGIHAYKIIPISILLSDIILC